MKTIKNFETGYLFGGTSYASFASFEEGFKAASEQGFNYLVVNEEISETGRKTKTLICWNTVEVLTYNQMLERLEDPSDRRMFLQRKNHSDHKKAIYIFNGKDDVVWNPRSYMPCVLFERIERINKQQERQLRQRLGMS